MSRIARAAFVVAVAAALAIAVMGVAGQPGGPHINVAPDLRNDAAVRLGAGDLRQAFQSSSAPPLQWVTAGLAGSAPVQAVAAARGLDLPALGPEDYWIRPLPADPPGALVVGGGPLGLAYGLLALAGDVRLGQAYLSYPAPRLGAADFSVRMVSDPLDPRYPGPEQALRWGYNTVMTEPWPALALYDQSAPGLYDPARFGTQRAWVENERRLAGAEIQQAKALHLRVIAPGDVILLPQQAAHVLGREVADAAGRYCIEYPRVQALLAAAIDELFASFPEIDGILVRTGENYPLGPLAGNTLSDGDCPRQNGDSLEMALRLLHQQVVVKHGRQLIYRGWDLGAGGLHATGVARLASALPVGENTLLSYKITETDFWRYNRLNGNLLQGPYARMVELQAAREYEGKGAFPDYVPRIHAQGLPEAPGDGGLPAAHRAGVRSAWVWAKGGGWDGPFLHDPLWVEANAAGLGRLLWDVDADPAALAREWAAGRFGSRAAPLVAQMLLRSPDAALKGFYIACYARTSGPWTPNLLWVRDDVIAGGDRLRALYDGCRSPGDAEAALAEKDQALGAVATMQEHLRAADPLIADRTLAATAQASLIYQQTLLDTLRNYLGGMFAYFRFADSGRQDQIARVQAGALLGQAQQAWDAHQAAGNRPGAPTAYKDGGMLAAINQAIADLQRP